jgi:hypothetical protein
MSVAPLHDQLPLACAMASRLLDHLAEQSPAFDSLNPGLGVGVLSAAHGASLADAYSTDKERRQRSRDESKRASRREEALPHVEQLYHALVAFLALDRCVQ